MSKETNGSLAGSKQVTKCDNGGDWGGAGRDDGGNSAVKASGTPEKHGQKKATRIAHIHANSGDNEK